MTSTITAIFRTHEIADHVRAEIARLGVSERHISVVGGSGSQDEIGHLNLPHDEAATYRHAVAQGHHVVSADVDQDKLDAVADIMRHPEQGVDIDAYEADYRATPDYERDTAAQAQTVELAEERMAIGKRDVNRGTTHVRTYVQEVPIEERIRLREEHVEVEQRRTGERVVSGAEADELFRERDIEVTEHGEEAVVAKEAVVTGEVVVTKEVETREEVVRDTVRKTEVDVDKR